MDNANLYWKTVVDTIQDGLMIVNPEGAIVSVNQGFEEITGYSRDEVLGRSCAILGCSTCKRAREGGGPHWCEMFRVGQMGKRRCTIVHKNGGLVHIVKKASVLRERNNKIIGAVETMADISDLMDKENQLSAYKKELDAEDRFHDMIGASHVMQDLFELIKNAGQSDAPVIIYGESGTGKELAARALHQSGLRSHNPYIKVNCAALNQSLLESELFGHVKGAFTGAHRDRKGRFEAAHKGDIFLDEIGDLPLATQIKLLRVLEEKTVERVGDHNSIKVDVRIISATNRNLEELIEQGEFRRDFFYRINVIPIRMPPLRDRLEDIPLRARSFFNRLKVKSGRNINGISQAAMNLLMSRRWPGNVRELRSALEYAFVTCSGDVIEPAHLPSGPRPGGISSAESRLPSGGINEIKKQRLIKALKDSKGNQSQAARSLGISRTSVWSQIKRFNINAGDFAGE